jgi:hypothetical protein
VLRLIASNRGIHRQRLIINATNRRSGTHFWPFDGFDVPPGRSVVAEVYPSVFRNRYPREERNGDQQDAYTTSRWLKEMDERGALDRYFHPPLNAAEQRLTRREGWILGIG